MQKKTYYYTCPECGAALDPGERCDCTANPVNLAEALPLEIARVRGILESYEQRAGTLLAAALMRQDIAQAGRVMEAGDTVGMVIACRALRQWKL